ncbi:hypothetical protein ALP75_205450 [Pseudomonas syringae pv. actinidiae]|nr:hypothetical protein ALP75_205450 [Pseudomonas syringae pv. actinidiae]
MGQGIGTGGGGQVRWQVEGQRGVQNRDARHHAEMQNGTFDLRLFIGNDRGTPYLGAGSCSGRQRNHRCDAVRIGAQVVLADVLEIPQRAALT